MDLPPAPWESDFWSTKEKAPAPKTSEQKRAEYNQRTYGSATITPKYREHTGELLGYNSSLTGWWYATLDEALADETLFKSDPRRWNQSADERMRARQDQGVPSNPNAGLDPASIATADPTAANGGFTLPPDVTGMTLGSPTTTASQPKVVNRNPAGFTDLLPKPATARTTVPRTAPAVSGFDPNGLPTVDRVKEITGGASGPPEQYTIQPGGQAPGAPAPTANREQIDRVLGGLQGYANDLYALSKDNTGLSAAEAQLNKAHELAKIRAADELRKNQAGALGAARSARNRGDRALLERVAIGEQAYLGQEAQRQQHAADTQLGLDLAILRAQEEDADREFRLEAISKAADLGLNVAALEVDLSKVNLQSATNWINQEFQQLLVDKQITEQQYEALLDFSSKNADRLVALTRDMAAIQLEYDKLAVEDQNVADQLLMQKYQIDEQTFVALKKIKEDGKFKWDQVLTALVGGVGSGATTALATPG